MTELPRPTRLFVIDDHPVVAEGLGELLGEEQFEVCGHADDIETAVREVTEQRPDLVLVDITLRSSSGLDVLHQLAALRPPPRMLVVSMHDETLFAERSLAAGAMGYVNKEVPVDELLRAVREVAAGRIYLSQQMTQRLLEGAPDRQGLATLTSRELDVFQLLGKGMSTRAIADQLGLSVKTVETHRDRIKRKLGVDSLYELIRQAVAWTLLPSSGPDTPAPAPVGKSPKVS